MISTMASIAALLVSGCGSKSDQTAGSLSSGQKVEAIASTLQACSYDGRPVALDPTKLGGPAPSECSVAVNRIMTFTGLPANFDVIAGPVDNAAAVILLDQNQLPHRVIAFNPQFMQHASALVGGSPWGPISVMAHEIAHHLSGHTITAGSSRPEIELEADKFSGFVLQKMGATLDSATQMILKLGSPHATPTHPGRDQRVDAIRQGWNQSCQQSGGSNCGGGVPSATPGSTTPPPSLVNVALPAPGSVPFKYGRFIADETGKLDPARMKMIDDRLYALAKNSGAEFAILVVNDLKGLSAENYARAMMRQLRVGKLDVGNGAVVVVAPGQRQAAVAFGPGFAKEAEFSNPQKQLVQWIDVAWPYCNDADGCGRWTDDLVNIFNRTLNNAANSKWTIDYPSLGALLDHYARIDEERSRTKRPFDPKTDQPLGNLVRISGTITSLSAPTGIGQANERLLGGQLGYTAVSMTTDEGLPVILYVSPQLAALMPSGKLKQNAKYTAVGRMQATGDRAKQASGMWLFSYDEI